MGCGEERRPIPTTKPPKNLEERFINEKLACARFSFTGFSCNITGPLELEVRGLVAINLTSKDGDYFAQRDPIVVRTYESDQQGCSERVALKYLDGLAGFAPR